MEMKPRSTITQLRWLRLRIAGEAINLLSCD